MAPICRFKGLASGWLRNLIADLDGPADPGVERAWLETSQRRYRELVEGKVTGIPGPPVFERLRSRLGLV